MPILPNLSGDNVFSNMDLLKFAQLSNATYAVADNKTVVESIGMEYILDIKDVACPVTIAKWGNYKVCSFQGTRVTKNLDIVQLFDDIDGQVMMLDNMRVHQGFWCPMASVIPKVIDTLNSMDGNVLITGHSLGGVRSHLAKAFFPGAEVVSFGAPKGATDAFWKTYYPDYPPIRVVHEKDFAPTWPYDGPWTQPAKLTWLHDGAISLVENRTGGLQISISDHSIQNGYIAALTKLVAVPPN